MLSKHVRDRRRRRTGHLRVLRTFWPLHNGKQLKLYVFLTGLNWIPKSYLLNHEELIFYRSNKWFFGRSCFDAPLVIRLKKKHVFCALRCDFCISNVHRSTRTCRPKRKDAGKCNVAKTTIKYFLTWNLFLISINDNPDRTLTRWRWSNFKTFFSIPDQ